LKDRSWEKNIQLLLQAYEVLPEMLPKGKRPKLVLVGEGPARAEIEQLCQTKGWNTVFSGFKMGAELAKWYASADIFAFPSFSEVCLDL
jgi:glycosyltransferase involved in cell wall biosynthesis